MRLRVAWLCLHRRGAGMPFFFDESAAEPTGWHGLAQKPAVEWADELYSALQESELRLIAIDFDRTLVRVHTSGCYEGPIEALVQQARPEFIHLIEVALAAGTSVAIVTFSPQAAMIRALLHGCIGPELAAMVQLRTADPSEMWSGVPGLPSRQAGKLHHIASAWEGCGLGDARACDWGSVLLIDDDRLNTDAAEGWGARAVLFNPDALDTEQMLLGDINTAIYGPPQASPSACFVTPPNPGVRHRAPLAESQSNVGRAR